MKRVQDELEEGGGKDERTCWELEKEMIFLHLSEFSGTPPPFCSGQKRV